MKNEVKNAVISAADLSTEDFGGLTGWLTLDYGGSGQGFGGLALYLPRSFRHHEIQSGAGHWIFRCMEIAGVTHWQDIVGKSIRVLGTHSRIEAIGHIVKDDWFYPYEDFKKGIKNDK